MIARWILPQDFLSAIFCYALQIDESHIKLVTEEMLYTAAIKAKAGNDNPADHIHGNFTDFNKEDLNNRAWLIFLEKERDRIDSLPNKGKGLGRGANSRRRNNK